MGKSLYDTNEKAKQLFDAANQVLGFDIVKLMFEGTDEDLKQTNVTQPAIFIHSVAAFSTIEQPQPSMVAGHSLGEFSALVANGVLNFEAALKLVSIRANAMQKACEARPSTMAAVLNLSDAQVEDICKQISDQHNEIVVPANYNCPGQLVISGTIKGIDLACEAMKAAGAKRALVLPVGGAFHSPLMQPAQDELAAAIEAADFATPTCPIYQNVVAKGVVDADAIKANLIAQLTGSVRWTQSVSAMVADGATEFIECGPGKVLQGLVSKIHKETTVSGIN
jgi:[acyl-carrier-protein] S-malonyltransferase